jgi:hypothetical protein
MSIKTDLQHSVLTILKHNPHGSYATQADRRTMLTQFASDLVKLGYGLRDIRGLKQKHINAILESWKNDLETSTIKNRLSALRFLCKFINKSNLIPSSNEALGIGKRKYIPDHNVAIYNPDFSKISNKYVRVSLELQRVFGLRREESMKIKPHMADRGHRLELLSTWCKGGRGRGMDIRTEEQRYWLDEAKKLAGKFGNSLIPISKDYKKHCSVYKKQVIRAGFRRVHGLRHAYIQQRYKELTGWDAPVCGGPKACNLTSEQKQADHEARLIISEEIGHSRKQITKTYLGK